MPISAPVARNIALSLAVGRVGLGLVAVVVPQAPLRIWLGSRGDDERTRLLGRGLGARDLALGLGAILAMRHREAARGWIEGGALADAMDAGVTVAGFRALPPVGRWVVLAAAASGAAVGAFVAPKVDSSLQSSSPARSAALRTP